jgi:hypothetical protein
VFDEVRNTEDWKHISLFTMCYILYPLKGIYSHKMGDVVQGGKLPHPMLRAFSSMMAPQRA